MIRFESEQTIDRSAEDVWAYAADVTEHPKWMAVEDAAIVRGTSGELGAVFRETIRMGPRRYVAELVVSESTPGRSIAWRVAGGVPLAGEARLDLEALGPRRTRARWSGGFRLTGLWRVLEPVMAGEVRSSEAAELVRLKGILEAPATMPPMA
ncbi:MAG: SRPBCC family protein [Chloroflexota bacterium]